MAVAQLNIGQRPFRAVWPPLAAIAPARVLYDYHEPTDTLTVSFAGIHEPSVIDAPEPEADCPDYAWLRLDGATDAVLGFHIEGFLRRAVHDHPAWLIVAERAGVPAKTLTDLQARLPASQITDDPITTLYLDMRRLLGADNEGQHDAGMNPHAQRTKPFRG